MKHEQFVDLFSKNKTVVLPKTVTNKKKLIKANLLKADSEKNNKGSEKKDTSIELEKRDDIVELIKVKCNCGKETKIVLDYGRIFRGIGINSKEKNTN